MPRHRRSLGQRPDRGIRTCAIEGGNPYWDRSKLSVERLCAWSLRRVAQEN